MTRKKDNKLEKVFQSDLIPHEVAQKYKERYDRLKKEVEEKTEVNTDAVIAALQKDHNLRFSIVDFNFLLFPGSPNF